MLKIIDSIDCINLYNLTSEYKGIQYKNNMVGYICFVDENGYVLIKDLHIFNDYLILQFEKILVYNFLNNFIEVKIKSSKLSDKIINSIEEIGFVLNNGYYIYEKKNRPYQIMNIMNKMKKGYVDCLGNYYYKIKDNFFDNYYLQNPNELMDSGVGLCWDYVELERDLFSSSGIENYSYAIVCDCENIFKNHTFLVYKLNDLYFWFENFWDLKKGIHAYDSIANLLSDVKELFAKNECVGQFNNVKIFLYEKPLFGCSCDEYINNLLDYKQNNCL